MLIAGPLADYVFEPGMRAGGGMAALFASLVGAAPGSGMSLIFIFGGILAIGVAFAGYLIPVIRDAETILPDHDALPSAHTEALEGGVNEMGQPVLADPP